MIYGAQVKLNGKRPLCIYAGTIEIANIISLKINDHFFGEKSDYGVYLCVACNRCQTPYNMKRHIALIVLSILTLTSCDSNGQDTFPDVITVSKSDKLKRVKGTKLFVTVPETYQPLEKLVRLQKNDTTYFQVIEVPNSNFIE